MTLFRNLGPFHTTAIGHGEMPLTIENNRGHDVGIETLHASLDAGCRHIDTAWAYYTPGEEEQTGEKLVREALDTWKGPREEVTVATKVGLRRAWDGDKPIWPRDGKPEHLIEYGKQSAQALGVDSIDLLYLHRHDPEVPYNESCEGIKALLDQGVAQWAGVSNVSIEQLKIAQEILGDFKGQRLDYFVSGYGTGGTVSGVGRVIKVSSGRPRRCRSRRGSAGRTHPACPVPGFGQHPDPRPSRPDHPSPYVRKWLPDRGRHCVRDP